MRIYLFRGGTDTQVGVASKWLLSPKIWELKMGYFSFDLNNDDAGLFLEWFKVKLDEHKCYDNETVLKTIIDVVKRPYLYDDDYNEFKNQELVEHG